MQAGRIVYFKKVRLGVTRKDQEVEYKGHGYGIYLGNVPPFVPGPPIEIVISNLGSIGFVKIDDLKEFLGDEVMRDFIAKWQNKYSQLLAQLAQKAINAGVIKARRAGPDGKPL